MNEPQLKICIYTCMILFRIPEVLVDNGITDVFCLCKQNELSYFRVRELFDAYHSKDIRVHHYPIEPDLSPDYKDMRTVLVDLWNALLNGSKVYIQLVLFLVVFQLISM